jgi:cytoskeletal protein RodZ
MAEMDQDPGYGGTVGERLRHAREARGLSLEDVATQTRVPIRHLRNIEDSNWEDLPAVTYTVGFGRSYANAVGLDGAEIGRELREQLGDGARAPQVSPTVYAPPDPARVPSRSLAWAAGLLLVVLVAGYLIWRSQLGDGGDETAQPAPAPSEQAQAEPQPQPQAAAPNLAGQQVTLVATGEVWFRISDRQGNRRVEDRTLRDQEQYQVPLSVAQPVISTGRPQVLRVTVAGRDLGPLAPEERRISNVSLLAQDLANMLQPGQPAAAAPTAAPAPR